MNFRVTYILFALAVTISAALFVVTLTDSDNESGGLVDPIASAGLKEKDVDAVEIVRTEPTEQKLVFAKIGEGKWELREPTAAKVDGFAIDSIVRDLFHAKPAVYPGHTSNLNAAGLDKPSIRITLKAGDRAATVNVGDTVIAGYTFVSVGERPNKIVAVKRADLAALFRDSAKETTGPAWELSKGLADLRARRLLGGDLRDPAAELKAVKITANGKDLALTRGTGTDWTFTSPANFGAADLAGASEATADRYTGVRPLLTAITGFQATASTDFIESPGDLAQYGLKPGDPNLVRIELTPASGPPEVLYLGKPVTEKDKPVVPAKVFAKVEGDSAVVKLATDRVDAIRKTVTEPGELRNKDLFAESFRDRVEAIDVTLGGATMKLRKVPVAGGSESKRWVLYGGPADPQEANQGAVQDLLTALTRPRVAKDILAAPNDAAFTPPEQKVTIKLWSSGLETPKAEGDKLPAEPKLTGTPAEVVFGKKEADTVFVRRTLDGKATDFKLPDALLVTVTKPRFEYLNLNLKSFGPPEANKLVFNRGPQTFELTKAEAGWTFVQPATQKGKPADTESMNALLGVLSVMKPVKVVSEQPSPEEVKKWGLDPARIKVTVGLTNGPEIVYEFGNETDDKAFVYTRQVGRPMVFTVLKVAADRFLTDDLRDRTLYKIDPATVTGLKIRGWKGLDGKVQTYEFEKKGNDWAAKSPAGFPLDPVKLAGLLNALSAPKVQTLIGLGKTEYGLSVDSNNDALEFTLFFGTGPAMTLVLGGKVNGTPLVYAASSAIPGEAATFNATAIRTYTEKPTALQK